MVYGLFSAVGLISGEYVDIVSYARALHCTIDVTALNVCQKVCSATVYVYTFPRN
jgi:hypothetical protein